MQLICDNCGTKNNKGAKYCSFCYKKLEKSKKPKNKNTSYSEFAQNATTATIEKKPQNEFEPKVFEATANTTENEVSVIEQEFESPGEKITFGFAGEEEVVDETVFKPPEEKTDEKLEMESDTLDIIIGGTKTDEASSVVSEKETVETEEVSADDVFEKACDMRSVSEASEPVVENIKPAKILVFTSEQSPQEATSTVEVKPKIRIKPKVKSPTPVKQEESKSEVPVIIERESGGEVKTETVSVPDIKKEIPEEQHGDVTDEATPPVETKAELVHNNGSDTIFDEGLISTPVEQTEIKQPEKKTGFRLADFSPLSFNKKKPEEIYDTEITVGSSNEGFTVTVEKNPKKKYRMRNGTVVEHTAEDIESGTTHNYLQEVEYDNYYDDIQPYDVNNLDVSGFDGIDKDKIKKVAPIIIGALLMFIAAALIFIFL